jgi:hypothetical protein
VDANRREDIQPRDNQIQIPNDTPIRRPVLADPPLGSTIERVIEYVAPFGFANR